MKKLFFALIIFFGSINLIAQDRNYSLGRDISGSQSRQRGGLYDYSDPESVNMKVSIWGGVQYAGTYKIPVYSSVMNLISLAGGPAQNTDLEDLRIYRVDKDSTKKLIKFSYNDLMWEEKINITNKSRDNVQLKAGDIVIIPTKKRYFWQDWLNFGLGIFSSVLSLTLIIINLSGN